MFAVIRTGGKQYKVAKDDVIRVEKLGAAAGEQVEIADVLLIGDGAETTLGTPLVAGAKVTATVVEQTRAPKILVFRKQRRKNHRRLAGHRQAVSVLRITDILADDRTRSAAMAATEPEAMVKAVAKPETAAEPEAMVKAAAKPVAKPETAAEPEAMVKAAAKPVAKPKAGRAKPSKAKE